MDIAVTYLSGDRLAVQVRGHRLEVDQPATDGGQDAGPTPTELFAASLAACVGFYAERFLRRHGLETDRLRVDCHATMATDRPARVAAIALGVGGLPELPPTAATPCSPSSSTAPSTTPSARRRRSRSASRPQPRRRPRPRRPLIGRVPAGVVEMGDHVDPVVGAWSWRRAACWAGARHAMPVMPRRADSAA
jgi:hypothetical protein